MNHRLGVPNGFRNPPTDGADLAMTPPAPHLNARERRWVIPNLEDAPLRADQRSASHVTRSLGPVEVTRWGSGWGRPRGL